MVNGILGFGDRLNQGLSAGLNSPLLQLGTNLLEAGGPTPGFSNFGQSLNRAFGATRNQFASQEQDALRRQLIEAQVAQINRPPAVRQPTAQSDLGKINLNFQKGFLTPEGRDAAIAQLGTGGESAFDEKVQALISTGIPRDVAIGIQAGRFATTRDPITGVAQVVDKSSGQIIFDGSQVTPEVAVTPTPEVATVPDVSEALGPGGVLKTGINKIADLFGGELPFQETGEAAAQLSNLNNEAIQLLRSGLGGRPNVQLQKRIERLLVEPNQVFSGEQEAKNKFAAIIETIDTETQRLERQVAGGGLRPATIDEARQKISELKALSGKFTSILASQDPKDKGDIMRFFN